MAAREMAATNGRAHDRSGADAERFLPLGQSTWYIMQSLLDGPKHGYAIGKDVESRSDGKVRLAIGNLYTALGRLLDQGLIERDQTPDNHDGDDRRKVYRLSGLGSEVLRLEETRLRVLLRGVARSLTARGSA